MMRARREVVSVSGGLLEECVGVGGRGEKEKEREIRPSLATRPPS